MGLKDATITMALKGIRNMIVNPNIEGIGVVKEISFKDGKIFLSVILEGLESHPLDICAEGIGIAEDGASVKFERFASNMAFAQNALNRFATRSFDIPEGSARCALAAAKKILNI